MRGVNMKSEVLYMLVYYSTSNCRCFQGTYGSVSPWGNTVSFQLKWMQLIYFSVYVQQVNTIQIC